MRTGVLDRAIAEYPLYERCKAWFFTSASLSTRDLSVVRLMQPCPGRYVARPVARFAGRRLGAFGAFCTWA